MNCLALSRMANSRRRSGDATECLGFTHGERLRVLRSVSVLGQDGGPILPHRSAEIGGVVAEVQMLAAVGMAFH